MTVTLRLGTPGLRCQGFWNPSSTFPRNCCSIEPKQTPQRGYNIQEDWPGKDRMNKEKSQCSFKGHRSLAKMLDQVLPLALAIGKAGTRQYYKANL